MKRIILSISIIALMLILFESCATIFGGRSNTITIESTSPDPVRVYIDDVYVGMAPGKVKVHSRLIRNGSELKCIMADDREFKQILIRKPHPVYFAADVIIGGIPLGVDYATGHLHRPWPRKINLDMETLK